MGHSILRSRIVNRQLVYWMVFLAMLFAILALLAPVAAMLPPSMLVSVYALLALAGAYYFISNIHGSPDHAFSRSVDRVLNPIVKTYRKALEKA